MSLAEYQQLVANGLHWDGAVARELLADVAKDVDGPELAISGESNSDSTQPPFFTPRMRAWYMKHIAAIRGTALQEIRNVFSAIDIGGGQRGFLLETECDRIDGEKFEQIAGEREKYFANASIKHKSDQLRIATDEYEQMKIENGGQDANEWPPKWYFLLLFVLAIPELPLNLDSFISYFRTVPAIAAIVVIAIAAAIGSSSHIIGTVLKQWSERFGGQVGRKDKLRSFFWLGFGVFLIGGAMAIVFLARSSLFSAAIERKMILGEQITITDYMGLIISVGGNFLIWLLGVVASFAAHSHIPEFGKKHRRMLRCQKSVLSSHKRELEHRNAQHIAEAEKKIRNIRTIEERQLKGRPDYIKARAQFEELKRADNMVLAILEEYRKQLIELGVRSANKLTFILEDINSITEIRQRRIAPTEYQQLKLRLPYV